MKTIETQIEVNSSPEKIWDVLMNFKDYKNWNPFITSISGSADEGNNLTVKIKPPGEAEMTFQPKVLVFNAKKEFRWKGKLLFKGLFDGEHFFIIEKVDEKRCIFHHGENFSGILIPFMNKIFNKTKKGFESMNAALKNECESN